MRCARDRGQATSDPPALTDPKAMAETDRGESPLLSVVVPVRNEAGNVAPLIAEIERACATLQPFEVIYVDDGSIGRDGGGDRDGAPRPAPGCGACATQVELRPERRRAHAACAPPARPSS